MSAWLTENAHIDVIVNALAAHDLLDGRDPRAVGQILWNENNRSVNYRYSERSRHPSYVLHTTEATLHPVAVLKACSCLEYQSCERPDWEKSQAFKILKRLRTAIVEANPELAMPVPSEFDTKRMVPAYYRHPVYSAAPWGFDDLDQAATHHYLQEV